MGWRGIPILAALGVTCVARILYDPMPATAPAAAINTDFDDASDLSRVDFTSWLAPTTAPTTAPITSPTNTPLADHAQDGSASIDSAANTSTDGSLIYFRKFTVEKIQWAGTASLSNGAFVAAPNPWAQPAIDIDTASSGSLVNFATDFSGETSSASRSKSSAIITQPPLSASITSANEPAFSIVGFDIPEDSPLPRPTTSLPPISVPEPGIMLLPCFSMWIGCRRPRD